MKKICIIILVLLSKLISAQGINDTSVFVPMASVSFSVQIPGGDMAKRFGVNSNIAGHFSIKTRSNWILCVEGYYLFGNSIKESGILDSLKSSNGEIINEYGEYANIILSERGFYIGANLGKIIPVWGPNLNSGIILSAGAGLLQHKIRFDVEGNNVPSLQGDYAKGYDRLTNGLAAKVFIGYLYLGKNKLKNFTAGFEFYQAWTKCRRDFNFDTRQKDNRQRNDLLYSFKIGWVVPFNTRTPDKFYTH
ncbi:MAG: hypothetical protein HY958_08085 [Bacteroidia bacterium]|nr:hypothetical protein [Bacteroidia bacterium]